MEPRVFHVPFLDIPPRGNVHRDRRWNASLGGVCVRPHREHLHNLVEGRPGDPFEGKAEHGIDDDVIVVGETQGEALGVDERRVQRL